MKERISFAKSVESLLNIMRSLPAEWGPRAITMPDKVVVVQKIASHCVVTTIKRQECLAVMLSSLAIAWSETLKLLMIITLDDLGGKPDAQGDPK
jgi:hypothetical protein